MDFNAIDDTPVEIHSNKSLDLSRDAMIAQMLNIPDTTMTQA
jgi:hypothetical protein